MSRREKKKKNAERRVIYYTDELHDEFSTAVIEAKPIDGGYRYDRDRGFSRLLCFFWYRIVAVPAAFLYLKLKFHHRVKGKEKLKETRKTGRFFFGNHTQIIGDALIPSFVCGGRKPFVIVHPNNVSMPYLGRITPYLGAIPLPDDMAATRNFVRIIEQRIAEKRTVVIYPEAHIWPYYTGIRPFTDDSFLYAARLNAPVYCFTNVYKKRRNPQKVRIESHIDGPFYPDPSLSPRARRKDLRDRVYAAMTARAKESDVSLIEYRKEGEESSPEHQ